MEDEESFQQKVIDHGLRAETGMSPEAHEKLEEHLESCSDWTATCQTCGVKLRGTRKEIMEHLCNE